MNEKKKRSFSVGKFTEEENDVSKFGFNFKSIANQYIVNCVCFLGTFYLKIFFDVNSFKNSIFFFIDLTTNKRHCIDF